MSRRASKDQAAGIALLALAGLAVLILVIKWLAITAAILAVPFGIWWILDRQQQRQAGPRPEDENLGRASAERRRLWVNVVREAMKQTTQGPTQHRQQVLVLSLPDGRGVKRSEIPGLTPELAALYAGKTEKTLARDVNRLQALGLIQFRGALWHSGIEQLGPAGSKSVTPR